MNAVVATAPLQVVRGDARTPLALEAEPIGFGGEARIFRSLNMPGRVAKIYHEQALAGHASRAKLLAMLARPPRALSVHAHGRELPEFAWPTELVEDERGRFAGFLMPEIAHDGVASLGKYMALSLAQRALSPEDQSLPRRIAVCRNLSAAIAEVHRLNHFVVDIKPQNIAMYRDTGMVCLLDNDSFSIADEPTGRRFPATAFSSQYVAPEILITGASAASVQDDTQDRFAMAVLMFQILNHGRHPFQGHPLQPVVEWNDDLCVRQGYYPYGLTPHPAIAPAAGSVHDCLDAHTRRLFDRAFTAPPAARPTAAQWRDHFDQLQSAKDSFVRCDRHPSDVRHIHLRALPCAACRAEDLQTQARDVKPVIKAAPAAAGAAPSSVAPAPRWPYWLAAAIAAAIMTLLVQESRQRGAEDSIPEPDASISGAPAKSGSEE